MHQETLPLFPLFPFEGQYQTRRFKSRRAEILLNDGKKDYAMRHFLNRVYITEYPIAAEPIIYCTDQMDRPTNMAEWTRCLELFSSWREQDNYHRLESIAVPNINEDIDVSGTPLEELQLGAFDEFSAVFFNESERFYRVIQLDSRRVPFSVGLAKDGLGRYMFGENGKIHIPDIWFIHDIQSRRLIDGTDAVLSDALHHKDLPERVDTYIIENTYLAYPDDNELLNPEMFGGELEQDEEVFNQLNIKSAEMDLLRFYANRNKISLSERSKNYPCIEKLLSCALQLEEKIWSEKKVASIRLRLHSQFQELSLRVEDDYMDLSPRFHGIANLILDEFEPKGVTYGTYGQFWSIDIFGTTVINPSHHEKLLAYEFLSKWLNVIEIPESEIHKLLANEVDEDWLNRLPKI